MELLNSIGLPDEIGFEIYPSTLKKLFHCEKNHDEYILELQKKCSEIYEKYNLGNMNINGDVNICIKSYNGNKKMVTEKLCIINVLYNYFNNSTYKYNGKMYFNQSVTEIESFYENEIKELKKIISKKIEDLKKVENFEDIKNISSTLYQSNLDAINNIDSNDDLLLCITVEEDIKKLKRLKIWLNEFIDDLSNVPSDDSLYKNINQDRFKLYLVFQLMSLINYLDDTNSVILAYNMVEIFNSIEDKTVLFDTVEVVELDDNSEMVWKCYENVNYASIELLINSFLKNSNVKYIINGLKQFEQQNQERILSDDYYDKITNLISKAIYESNKSGFKDVDLNNLNNAIKEELVNAPTLKKQNQLKSYIDRIEFYLNDTKAYKVQEGTGLFKDSHVLYFTNGIVAIDRLNGDYGYLYIMPINTYFEILKNTELKSIIEIRNVVTVKPISHKKANWKEEASREINSHNLTEEEFEILENISGIILPINVHELEKAKQKYSDNQFILEKLEEKENERNEKLEEIDQELRNNSFSYDDEENEYLESASLLKAEEEILENICNYKDFLSIFEYNNKIKTKRNPKVSFETKMRTTDLNGAIRCEMCGEFESFDTKNFEAHHIIPLSKGGIDNIYNTVCLCANCHARMHGNIPFTFNLRWKMLMNVRTNLSNSAPYYVKNFDRLFNPYYNAIYNNTLSEVEQLKRYEEEQNYYIEHKEEEDKKFLLEFNSFKK